MTDNPWVKVTDAPLYGEHVLLGAHFKEEEPLLAAPHNYGDVHAEREAVGAGAALIDLCGMNSVLVSGGTADTFMATACGCRRLSVGDCSFGAVLTGDGSVASIPLIARTGDHEYLLWDPTERGLMLVSWLCFLSRIEQKGYKPFEGVAVDDVSTSLHPLALWGPQAPAVLADYLASADLLPREGQIASLQLDRIASLVARIPMGESPCYLLMVPPAAVRVLWRSFLSFPVVVPMGREALSHEGRAVLPWLEALLCEGQVEMAYELLLEMGLIRPDGGYVGERALASVQAKE